MSYKTDLEMATATKEELEELILFLIHFRDESNNELVKSAINQMIDGAEALVVVECPDKGDDCEVEVENVHGLLDIFETIVALEKELELEVALEGDPYERGEECGETKEII